MLIINNKKKVGYGDVLPKNPLEKIFSIIFILMGSGTFGFCISAIGKIINVKWKREAKLKFIYFLI